MLAVLLAVALVVVAVAATALAVASPVAALEQPQGGVGESAAGLNRIAQMMKQHAAKTRDSKPFGDLSVGPRGSRRGAKAESLDALKARLEEVKRQGEELRQKQKEREL